MGFLKQMKRRTVYVDSPPFIYLFEKNVLAIDKHFVKA